MTDLYISFTVSIAKLNKLVQKIKSIEMGKHDLQPIHASCVYYLSKNPQGLTAKELRDMTVEDKAAVSRALKTLQDKGYAEYAPHGRNEFVKLTEAGDKLAQDIKDKVKSAVDAGSADLTAEQREFFYSSLLEITNHLTEYYHNLMKSEGEQ